MRSSRRATGARSRWRNELGTVAFPAISTGIYGFPKDRAARIAVETVTDELARRTAVESVVFACFSDEDLEWYVALGVAAS